MKKMTETMNRTEILKAASRLVYESHDEDIVEAAREIRAFVFAGGSLDEASDYLEDLATVIEKSR